MSTTAPDIIFPHLGIYIETLNREFITIGTFSIYWYGFVITLGFVLGCVWAQIEAKRTGQDPKIYSDFLIPYAFIAALVGSRAYFVIFSWDSFRHDLMSIFMLRDGGLAVYGGILATTLASYVFCKKRKVSFWIFTDTAVQGLLIGQMLGRLGNFFNREAFGGHTDSLFAVMFRLDQVRFATPELLQTLINHNGVYYLQVHPTFFYEIFWNLCVFIFILWYRKRKQFDGELLFMYLAFHGMGRFWIESLRADQLTLGATNIAVSQLLSAILVVVGTSAIVMKRIEIKKKTAK